MIKWNGSPSSRTPCAGPSLCSVCSTNSPVSRATFNSIFQAASEPSGSGVRRSRETGRPVTGWSRSTTTESVVELLPVLCTTNAG